MLIVLAALAQGVPMANAKLGHQLAYITPDPAGNGRGLELRPGTSIGYYTFEGSQNAIYEINMRTGKPAGQLTTDLQAVCHCGANSDFGFGGLSWQRSTNLIWGSEYGLGSGWVDTIDPATGDVKRAFNAKRVNRHISDIEGLAVAPDGTLWVSGEEALTVYHFTAHGRKLGSFRAPFAVTGLAVDGARLWLADYPDNQLRAYTKRGRAIPGMSFSVVDLIPYPLDISIDRCTFRGKKAIWVYSAGTGEVMAAYQIGRSTNAGCAS